MEWINRLSEDVTGDNVEALLTLFPDVATEVRGEDGELHRAVDYDVLREKLGDVAEGSRERYQFTWPGKREARAEASRRIDKVLRPCPEESKDWDTTQNLYIEGDNLDALKILRKNYAGKIKMIYIDPPYNTGNDFIYDDDFAISREEYDGQSGDFDERGRLVENRDSNGRFHSDWCSMMLPRLLLARDLLTDDGLIFISIDDNELDTMIMLCDEVYGANSRVNTIIWHYGKMSNESSKLPNNHEYVLVYKRSNLGGIFNKIKKEDSEYRNRYIRYVTDDNTVLYGSVKYSEDKLILGRIKKIKEVLNKTELDDNDILFDFNKEFKSHSDTIYCSTIKGNSWENVKEFETQKPLALISLLLKMQNIDDGIVLDFFSGSATTAHAVTQLNAEDGGKRKFIMVQIPEVCPEDSDAFHAGYSTIADLGKERIRRVGAKIVAELKADAVPFVSGDTMDAILDVGFRVLKVSSTNYEDVMSAPTAVNQDSISGWTDNIKPDRTSLDLLFSVFGDLAIPYSARIETLPPEQFSGHEVFSVEDGTLVACFDENLDNVTIEAMAQLQPSYCVVRDASFVDDAAASNFEELFKTFSPTTQLRVL